MIDLPIEFSSKITLFFLKKMSSIVLGKPDDEFKKEFHQAIDVAKAGFHEHFGNRYGDSSSTFIESESNQRKLFHSTSPRGKRLTISDLDLQGFDGNPPVPEEHAIVFLDAFYKAIDQTNSRALDRDLSIQKVFNEVSEVRGEIEENNKAFQFLDTKIDVLDHKVETALRDSTLPTSITDAILEQNLTELSNLITTGQLRNALDYATQYINSIDDALDAEINSRPHSEKILLTYRQRLLFAAASVASWQGDIKSGREYWRCAYHLGQIESKLHKQAVITLFNVRLIDELRNLMSQMDHNSDVYKKFAVPCLAYLEKDWHKVDKLLADAPRVDKILQRVHARLHIIDAGNVEAVQITSQLLDDTDSDVTLPVVNLIRAQLTLDLLTRIIREYTPLDYDRHPLINSLRSRLYLALDSTESNSNFRVHAIATLGITAELLRDKELEKRLLEEMDMLNDEIRSFASPLHDSGLTPEKFKLSEYKNHYDSITLTLIEAEFNQDSGLSEDIETKLYEALFTCMDKRLRKYVLLFLVQHLRRMNRDEEAQQLINSTPLRPADNWLVRVINLPPNQTPLDLIDEVDAFPLDVDVTEYIINYILSSMKYPPPEEQIPNDADQKIAETGLYWASRLMKLLPTSSSRLRYAWALYGTRKFEELLAFCNEIDPVYDREAVQFRAWALIGLRQTNEAIDCLILASQKFPESIYFLINAAKLLLTKNQPKKAINLLEPYVDAMDDSSRDAKILFYYAKAILYQEPNSSDSASRAFDLFASIYDELKGDPKIAQLAWHTAQASGRSEEARHFFESLISAIPIKLVETKDDFYDAIQIKNHGVFIEGGKEYLIKMYQEDQKRSAFLTQLLHAHALSYSDLFNHSSKRSWEIWAYWIKRFELRSNSTDKLTSEEYSILADLPSHGPEYEYFDQSDFKLYMDLTAILTLGVLGPNIALQILDALKKCYVPAGILEELHLELNRICGRLTLNNSNQYVRAAHFLQKQPDTIVKYSSDFEDLAPKDQNFGACRIDIGVAILYKGLYVTDIHKSAHVPDNRIISSKVLLRSLHEVGAVSSDQAFNATQKHPNTFDGWATERPEPIPEALIFDEYAILDWIDSGLSNALENRVKMGPWAWMCISEESLKHDALVLAHQRLKGITRVLQAAMDKNILIEIDVDSGFHQDDIKALNKDDLNIEKFWPCALKTIQTAQANEFQIWADDRFFTLFLRYGGPNNLGDSIRQTRAKFNDWEEIIPPISTLKILDQLVIQGHLSFRIAQDAISKLYLFGYRGISPLFLTYTVRQYPIPTNGQITPPFMKLLKAIKDIPRYFPESFNTLYGNREHFICKTTSEIVRHLIVRVWKSSEISENECCILSDALLEATEHVFEEVFNSHDSYVCDYQDALRFWPEIAYSLQTIPVVNQSFADRSFSSLKWLGKAVGSRSKQRNKILLLLEDNVLDSLKYALQAFEGSDAEYNLKQIVSTFTIGAFIPLTDDNFNTEVTQLMRRTVSMLGEFSEGGRATITFYQDPDRKGTPLMINEKDNEIEAFELIEHIISENISHYRYIWGTDLVFRYDRPVPEAWHNEGFPLDEKISVSARCSLFLLLWDSPRHMREPIINFLVRYLSVIDPVFAYKILHLKSNLLDENSDIVNESLVELGIELLRSGYFELHRNLAHAIHRFRHYDAETLHRFIGWIGEKEIETLWNHIDASHVWHFNALLAPIEHYYGRALLTDQFDDENKIIEFANQFSHFNSAQDRPDTDLTQLIRLIEDKAYLAENADDPFVSAWALRVILLILSKMDGDLNISINKRSMKASEWATNYIITSISPNLGHTSEIVTRMQLRRKLSSSLLLLSSYACSGKTHWEAYRQGEYPQAVWLTQSWLLSTKLQISLIAMHGSLENATQVAQKAVSDLTLNTNFTIPIRDSFDLQALTIDGEDIGSALTLTAMFKVKRLYPDTNNYTDWWTDEVRNSVEKLSTYDNKKGFLRDTQFTNSLGLIAPLRVQLIAQKLMNFLTT